MKIFTSLFTGKALLVGALLAGSHCANAQMPQCLGAGGLVYVHSGNSIYNLDPTQPIILGLNPSLNTIPMAPGGQGLAVSMNLNSAAAPSPTFYTTVGGNYSYYDGTTWIGTGHTVGNGAAVNPGAGGGFIYNIVGGTGQIYKYDGTGPGTLLITIADFLGGGPYDVQVDCAGNFYVLKNSLGGTGQWMRKYSPTGTLLTQYTLVGSPNSTAGGGFGIIGSTVYFHNNAAFWTGVITGTTVTINQTSTVSSTAGGDYGSCEIGAFNSVQASIDTGYYCGSGPGVPVSASGQGPFTWTVLSGPAVVTPVTSNNSSVTITAPFGISRVEVRGPDTTSGPASLCPNSNSRDTVTIVVPSGLPDAGVSDTILGCGVYVDTLNGVFGGFPSFVTFNYSWTPAGTILSGGNTPNPIVSPGGYTRYYFNVSTAPNRGNCQWKDSVDKWVKDVSVNAEFTFDINWGCGGDTVMFTNQSFDNTLNYWDFNDNSIGDTAENPTHIYNTQNTYNVRLLVSNGLCRDSIIHIVDLLHPLDAEFTVDEDSVCATVPISFTSTSITTTKNGIDPSYLWIYGDGTTDTGATATHTYANSGVYTVRLVVKDFVPCTDTQSMIVVVDSIPHVRFSLSDTVLCEGKAVRLIADYLHIGNIGIQWNFGDGLTADNIDDVLHSYDSAGTYTVQLSSFYRVCDDTATRHDITINTFPSVNIGPDTVLCPMGDPIIIADLNGGAANPLSRYIWNTGDTTGYIVARDEGVYWATLSMNGCQSTDSVTVFKDCYLDVPNAFSPNGDGDNDYFLPRQLLSRSLATFRMSIFNRWGLKIYETTSIDGRGWDGKFNDAAQPTGVYIYTIDAVFDNDKSEHYTGNVTLLR